MWIGSAMSLLLSRELQNLHVRHGSWMDELACEQTTGHPRIACHAYHERRVGSGLVALLRGIVSSDPCTTYTRQHPASPSIPHTDDPSSWLLTRGSLATQLVPHHWHQCATRPLMPRCHRIGRCFYTSKNGMGSLQVMIRASCRYREIGLLLRSEQLF